MTERDTPARPTNRFLFLIAARAPTPGATKTRLGASIGMERAAGLYRAFLIDLARRFTPEMAAAAGHDLGWAYTPPETDFAALIERLGGLPTDGAHVVPQFGDGWGERQANLLRWGAERGYERTVLVASDSPHLRPEIAGEAFHNLEHADVVIGRVVDGGYYLIGLRGFHDVFSGVPMGTGGAADTLIARARSLGLRVAELSATFDIDEIGDIDRLVAELRPDGGIAPATWAALADLGLRSAEEERGA